MNKTKLKKIKAIEQKVPQEWRDALMKEEYVAPDVRNEALATLKDYQDRIPTLEGTELYEATRDHQRLQNMMDAGYFDAKEMKVDEDMAKQIEDFIDEEMKKAIESGELSAPKDDKEFIKYVKKLHKHGTTNQKPNLSS